MRWGHRRGIAVLIAATLTAGCTSSPAVPIDEPPAGSGDDTVDGTPDGAEADGAVDQPPLGAPPPVGGIDLPTPAPPPLIASPVPATREALQAQLQGLIEEAGDVAPDLAVAVLVVDEAGREVVAIRADDPMLPASTLKLVTAAAVLTTLGPRGRLTTVVDGTAGIDAAGVLDGDLLLIGSGDPTLATDEYGEFVYPARPRTPLAALADDLVAAGLRQVTGSVRGLGPGFADEPLPTGWRDAYLHSFDGRYIAGLTVDAGLRTLVEYPEPEELEDLEEPPADVREADETPEDPPLRSEDPPTVRVELATAPATHAASELTRLLEERDVEVIGAPTPEPPPRPTVARFARVSSPTLLELLVFTVQRSDNHLADQLFQVVGRTRTGEGSWRRGERALLQVLDRFGVDRTGARFADGSGLSRDDRVTARLLVDLDRAMTTSPRYGGDWRRLFAVAGESGTLRTRLVGTPAVGRFLGKTGSLRDVTAVSGQVLGAGADPVGPARPGERGYHLAVIANDADGSERGVARAVMDEAVLLLVADLDGCRLTRPGEADGVLGRPPTVAVCPD